MRVMLDDGCLSSRKVSTPRNGAVNDDKIAFKQ